MTSFLYRHSCSFCGWSRPSASPVMLAPACAACGCVLDAVAVSPGSGSEHVAWSVPASWSLALRVLGVLVGLLGLYAAARLGWRSAGPSGALVAFGVGAFLLLPFVPERLS
jgi:hypothetical protein